MLLLQHCDTLINASSMGVLKFKTAKEYKGLLRLGGRGGEICVTYIVSLVFETSPFFLGGGGGGGEGVRFSQVFWI